MTKQGLVNVLRRAGWRATKSYAVVARNTYNPPIFVHERGFNVPSGIEQRLVVADLLDMGFAVYSPLDVRPRGIVLNAEVL